MDQSLNNTAIPIAAASHKTDPAAQPAESAGQASTPEPATTKRARWRLAFFSACIAMAVAGAGLEIVMTPKGAVSPLTQKTANTLSILKQAFDSMWPTTTSAKAVSEAPANVTEDDRGWESATSMDSLMASSESLESGVVLESDTKPAKPHRTSVTSRTSSDRVAPSDKTTGTATQACPDAELVCLVSPRSGAVVRGVVQVRGTATAPNFAYYKFEFENDPRCRDPYDGRQICFLDSVHTPAVDATLMTFDTHRTVLGARIPNGTYWVRLVVVDQTGNELPQKARIRITIQN